MRSGTSVCVADGKRPELLSTIIVNKTTKEPIVRAISLQKRSDSTYRS